MSSGTLDVLGRVGYDDLTFAVNFPIILLGIQLVWLFGQWAIKVGRSDEKGRYKYTLPLIIGSIFMTLTLVYQSWLGILRRIDRSVFDINGLNDLGQGFFDGPDWFTVKIILIIAIILQFMTIWLLVSSDFSKAVKKAGLFFLFYIIMTLAIGVVFASVKHSDTIPYRDKVIDVDVYVGNK